LKPAGAADAATLDRIFLDLDAKAFAAREKASRELAALGAGAAAVWETDAAKQGSSRYSADKLAK